MLVETIAAWRPHVELNIEGYPDARLLEIASEARPEQCTLVPDAPDAFTSEEGFKLGAEEMALVRPAIAALKAMGARVILFIDRSRGAGPHPCERCRWCRDLHRPLRCSVPHRRIRHGA
jgi:pyridoxine 5-phosphate synthase